MKKITYILVFVSALLLTSCNLERKPKATPEQAPFKSISEAQMNRDAVYALLRNVESPNNLNSPEYQGDLYHLTCLDNNTIYGVYNWEQKSIADHEFLTSYYFNYYTTLMQANYFMFRAEELMNSTTYEVSDADKALLKEYIGEFKAIRALAHWRLVQRFSKPWDGTTDGEDQNGIILMTSYDPLITKDAPKASRAQVYESMLDDINSAIEMIPAVANKEKQPAMYITRDYALGLKARICLTKKDWQGAKEAAEQVIANYPLTTLTGNRTDDIIILQRLWKTEDSPEILVRLNATPQIGAVSAAYVFGGGFGLGYTDWDDLTNFNEELKIYHTPYMILEQWVVNLYADTDLRKEVYIGKRGFYFASFLGKVDFNALTKFEGNPSLNKDPKQPEFKFGVHLMNAAEMYLVAAEAALELGDITAASNHLAQLQNSRGLAFDADNFTTPESLRQEIRNERVRELVGEGFRVHDLMRWGLGFTRSDSQKGPEALANALAEPAVVRLEGRNLTIEPDNKLWVWEFPTRDLETNPNLNTHRNW